MEDFVKNHTGRTRVIGIITKTKYSSQQKITKKYNKNEMFTTLTEKTAVGSSRVLELRGQPEPRGCRPPLQVSGCPGPLAPLPAELKALPLRPEYREGHLVLLLVLIMSP